MVVAMHKQSASQCKLAYTIARQLVLACTAAIVHNASPQHVSTRETADCKAIQSAI